MPQPRHHANRSVRDDGKVSPHPAPPTPQPPATTGGLQLRLHGDACVLRAGQAVLPLRGRAAALVAMAALSPGLRRDLAAATIWPDAANARQNLRQQLLRFKQVLGVALLEGDDTLRLAAGVQLHSAAPGAELLAGQAAGSDDFGHWLAAQRQGQAQAQRQPLLQALAAAEAEGDLDHGLRLAQDLLSLDPQDETSHAALMRLHYLRGEPAAGLAAYQRLSDWLSARFGTQPAASSQALAAALRSMGAAPARPQALAQSLPLTLKRPPVMAGRAAELAAVHDAWADGQAVLLEGEAGMGKSRLVAECLAGLAAPVLQAAGRPGDSGAPYSTLARLLRPALDAHAALLSRPAQEALARLVGSSPADPPPATRPLAPGAMQAAVAELLDQAGADTVVLDDLHFADAATLELISGVASQVAPRRWLFAQRPAEAPSAAHTLREALLEMQRMTLVTLQPLDEAAATTLVDTLAITGLQGHDLAPALVRHSGGNPLFLLETLKQGLADGSLARGQLPRPASVGKLIERRLLRLGQAALTLARVAAIAGVDFRIELAEAAIGQSAVQLASAWQELQDAQVLRDEAFAHDLVADAVLRGIPPVVARRVHAQCADWLAGHGGEPARVARHWQQGGDPLRAATAYADAAGRAAMASRLPEAAALHGLAAEQFAAAGEQERAFAASLSRLNTLINGPASDDAVAQALALQAQAATELQRLQALRIEVDLLAHRGHTEQAITKGLAAMALARSLGALQEQTWLATPLTGCLLLNNRAAEAQALLLPLQDWVEQHGDTLERARYLGLRGSVLAQQGRLRESMHWRERGLALEREAGVTVLVATSLQHIAVAWGQLGLPERAERAAAEALALCDVADRGGLREAVLRFTHARCLVDLGHYGDALEHLDQVLALLGDTPAAFWHEAATLLQALAWTRLGQAARARKAVLQADEATSPRLRAQRRQLRLELAPQLGQPAPGDCRREALALLGGDQGVGLDTQVAVLRALPAADLPAEAARLERLAGEQDRHGLQLAALAWLAHGAAAQGDVATTRAAAQRARALLDEGCSPGTLERAEWHWLLWRALKAAGDTVAAHKELHDGVAWLQRVALPQVPPAWVESFLYRHPVHRELMAQASAGRSG